jgi:hypothetical protein
LGKKRKIEYKIRLADRGQSSMEKRFLTLCFILLMLAVSVTACTEPQDTINPTPTAATAASASATNPATPTPAVPEPVEEPWTGEPLIINPQPNSTLLPAGTDKVEHWVDTIGPAEVRYSVGEKLAYERVVGAFPDGESALMLVCARLRHISSKAWEKKDT